MDKFIFELQMQPTQSFRVWHNYLKALLSTILPAGKDVIAEL